MIIGGSGTRELRALAGRMHGPGPATLLDGGRQVSRRDAALWNGTAGSVLELYEGSRFTRARTAIQLVPAALAEAERAAASGAELLVAVVAGYEVAARVARTWHLKDLHHPSGTWGVLGAATAVGRLRRLSGQRLVIVSTRPPTIRYRAAKTMERPIASFRGSASAGVTFRNILAGR